MSLINVQGVVLKYIKLGESDKIITLLTDKLGKIDAVAHGARRTKSKFMASTQPFCYGEYQLHKGKNLYTISQSNIINSFQTILMDLDKVAYGMYFLELIDNITENEVKSISILALILKTLYILTHDEVDLRLLRLVFDFKAISISGYMPQIVNCVKCGRRIKEGYFSINRGGMICTDCKDNQAVYGINKETLNNLHIIKNIKLENLRNIKYDEKSINYLQNIMTKYILYQTETDFKSLSILDKIKR
ncbi:DNA repair protein RecO [Caloramator sp. E03]|uniref:DNA repair protein RecO n=1 Tax=Caloramator sp. E03 TaxID=2576307 RepID=UPI00143D476D|nr:DNA repair protein RecO [Caloramator sp. E03]